MSCLGLKPEYVILDAGYCTLENMEGLLESRIGFITRLKPNYRMYKDMVEEFTDRLGTETRVLHKDRFIRVCSAEREMYGRDLPLVKQMLQNHLKARKEELSAGKRKNKDAIPAGICRHII